MNQLRQWPTLILLITLTWTFDLGSPFCAFNFIAAILLQLTSKFAVECVWSTPFILLVTKG